MLLKNGKDQYSVIDTQLQPVVISGKKLIEKRYRMHVKFDFSPAQMRQMIVQYIKSLEGAGIPVPGVAQSFVHGNEIVFVCHDAGKNIFELGLTPAHTASYLPKIKKMLITIAQAKKAGIFFDPHPKNFVFFRNRLSYVDFYPPYSEAFINERLRLANHREHEIVARNFAYFSGDYLASHFCGDFLNMNTKYHVLFRPIYRLAKSMGLTSKSLVAFTQEAVAIRKLEDQRLKKGIYLV